jgi:hypothetical protein
MVPLFQFCKRMPWVLRRKAARPKPVPRMQAAGVAGPIRASKRRWSAHREPLADGNPENAALVSRGVMNLPAVLFWAGVGSPLSAGLPAPRFDGGKMTTAVPRGVVCSAACRLEWLNHRSQRPNLINPPPPSLGVAPMEMPAVPAGHSLPHLTLTLIWLWALSGPAGLPRCSSHRGRRQHLCVCASSWVQAASSAVGSGQRPRSMRSAQGTLARQQLARRVMRSVAPLLHGPLGPCWCTQGSNFRPQGQNLAPKMVDKAELAPAWQRQCWSQRSGPELLTAPWRWGQNGANCSRQGARFDKSCGIYA